MRWAYPDTPMPASMSLECKVTLQAPVYVINRLNSSLARLHPQVELVSDQLTCFIHFFLSKYVSSPRIRYIQS